MAPYYTDPAQQVLDRIRSRLPQAAQQGLRTARSGVQALEPEQRQALAQTVTDTALSGLETLGNIFDAPGAIVRGVLAGDPNAAISPVTNLFSQRGRVTGRDLMRQYDIIGPRDTWENWALGLAGEIALDPLTYALGPAGALTKAGRFTKGLGMMDDISKIATTKLAKQAAMKSLDPIEIVTKNVAEGGTTFATRAEREAAEQAAQGLQPSVETVDAVTPSMLRKAMDAPVGVPERRIGQAEAKQLVTGGDVLQYLPEERMGEAQDLMRAMRIKPSDIANQQLGSIVGAAPPFGPASWVWSGPRAVQVSRKLDELGPIARSIPGVGWTVEHLVDPLVSVFDYKGQQMETPATRRAARQAFRAFEQAEPETMFKVANWMDQLEKQGVDIDDVSQMYEILEQTDPEKVPDVWRPVYDEFHAELGEVVREAPEWGIPFTVLKDKFNKYVPSQTTHAKMKGGTKKLREVLDGTDPGYLRRLDITRHIKGGHKTLRDIFMDEDLNRIIDPEEGAAAVAETATDPAPKLDRLHSAILDKYGDQLPEFIDEKGTYYPTKEAVKEAEAVGVRNRGDIARSLADWMMEMPEEARKSGFYDVNPLVGFNNRMLAAKQAVGASKAYHDFLMEPGVLGEAGNDTKSMWDVSGELGLNKEKVVRNIAERRGATDELEAIAARRYQKALRDQAAKADEVKSGQMTVEEWMQRNAEPEIPLKYEQQALREYGESLHMAADEAKNVVSWNLGFTTPRDAAKLTQFFDRFLNLFRTGVTTPWPAFVSRNLLSGQWQNFIAGMFGPKDPIDAYRLLRGMTVKDAARIPAIRRLFRERQLAALGESPDAINVPARPQRPQAVPADPETLGPRPDDIEIPPQPVRPAPTQQPDPEYVQRTEAALDMARVADELESVKPDAATAGQATGQAATDFAGQFSEAFDKLDAAGGKHNFVSLVDLRRELSHLSREEFDAGLNQLRRDRQFSLGAAQSKYGLSPEERAAGIYENDDLMLNVSRREGATPRATPEPPKAAGVPLIQVYRAFEEQGTTLSEFSELVDELKKSGDLVTTDDGKRILPKETMENIRQRQENPPTVTVEPGPEQIEEFERLQAAYDQAKRQREEAKELHDNPPMVDPPEEAIERYKQGVSDYRRARKRYRRAVERHSVELRDPTDQEATEILRELLYAYKVAGKYQGQAPGVIEGVEKTDTVGEIRRAIPGYYPLDYGLMGRKAMGRTPETTLTGRDGTPLEIRGVTGENDSISRATTFGPLAAAEDINYMAEGLNRISPFINQLRKGVSPYEAARRVGGAQVRYGSRYYTPTERAWLARAFPFYKFSSRVLPWHLEKLVTQPGGLLRRSIQLANEGKDETDLQPQYVAESASIPIGGALGPVPEGTDRYLTGFGVMAEDPAALIGDLRPQTFFGELLSRANPLVRLPAEVAAQELFFQRGPGGGREMVDVDPTLGRTLSNIQELAKNPMAMITGGHSGAYRPVELPGGRSIDYMLLNSPAARFFTTLRGLTDTRKSLPAKALQYGTGLRITDVSEAARDAVLRENVERYMLDNMRGRPFETIYIPDWQKERMTPDQLSEAEALQLLLRDVRARAQQRRQQKEAAGS